MNARRFWLTRLASIVATILFLAFMQKVVSPNLGQFDNRLLILAALFATLAVSLNLINGITGQFSIGHAAFYQIGAYATAFFAIHHYGLTPMPDWLWLFLMVLLGAVAAGAAGFIVGLPSLRLRGDYLAVATLGFGEIVRIVVQNRPSLGGSYGMNVKVIQDDAVPLLIKITPLWMVLLLLIVCIAVCRNLLKSAHGLQFLAVREDELAASAMGVNTTRTKVAAFVIGAAFAGMAGALFSHYEGFITIKQFDMIQSFMILTMVVIGGTGSITGAAVAGIALTLLPESFRDLPPISAIATLAFVIATVVLLTATAKLRQRFRSEIPGALQTALVLFGLAGCVLAAFLAFWIWRQDVPVVTKVIVALISLCLVLGLVLTHRRMKNLAVFGMLVAVLGAIVGVTYPIMAGLESIPFVMQNLAGTKYQAGNLRIPVFAIALVLIMLSRPQGLFGHHELSWDWLRSLFRRHPKEPAVAS